MKDRTESPDSMNDRRTVELIVGCVLFLAIAFVVVRRDDIAHHFSETRQFLKYTVLAEQIVAGDIPRDRLNDVSPLYLIVTALWRKAGMEWDSFRTLQIAMVGAVALLAFATAQRFGGSLAGVVAAGAVLTSRAAYVNSTEFEPETLVLLLNASALYFIVRKRGENPTWALFAGALLLGASAVARPTVIPACFLLGLFVVLREIFRDHSWREALKLAVPFLVGVLVPIFALQFASRVLTGQSTIMNPGTVFYEGMNPNATGYGFVEPFVVGDIRSMIDKPDSLHIVYRQVASMAEKRVLTPEETNRYWLGKSLRFARRFPGRALRLLARKLFFSFHSYDAWDLGTLVNRERELSGGLWVSFGLLLALAAIGGGTHLRDAALPLWLFVSAYVLVMMLFYVTSRQRNAIIPALAILAGLGFSRLVFSVTSRQYRRSIFLVLSVVLLATILGRDYGSQTENRYYWSAVGESKSYVASALAAEAAGDEGAATRLRSLGATWLVRDDPYVPETSPKALATAAMVELAREPESDQRSFDIALAFQKAGRWNESSQILQGLEDVDYQPERKGSAVDSLAYYRARIMLRSGRPEEALRLLNDAERDAAGDPSLLALRALLAGSDEAKRLLFELHDPFTARMALARAYLELGQAREALRIAEQLVEDFPEWQRAEFFAMYVRSLLDAAPKS